MAKSTVIFASLVILSCIVNNVFCEVSFGELLNQAQERGIYKRQTSTCPRLTGCLNKTASCSAPDPCYSCGTTLTNCIASTSDPDTVCQCFLDAVTCARADTTQCPGVLLSAQDSCDIFARQSNTSCACTNFTAPAPTPTSFQQCKNGDYCKLNNTGFGVCDTLALGTCTTSNQCGVSAEAGFGYSYTCSGSNCIVAPGTKSVGDACADSSECASGSCVSNVCMGISRGGDCVVDSQCAVGLYCNGGTCEKTFDLGANCTYTGSKNPCGVGRICGATNKCVAQFSVANNGACKTSSECVFGSYCKGNGLCAAMTTTNCTVDSDCANVHPTAVCTCDTLVGQPYCQVPGYHDMPSTCSWSVQELFLCLRDNECNSQIDQVVPSSGSCAYTHCMRETNCLLSCMTQNHYYTALKNLGCATYPSAWVCQPASTTGVPTTGVPATTGIPATSGSTTAEPDGTTGTKSSSSVVIYSFALLALMAVLAIVF